MSTFHWALWPYFYWNKQLVDQWLFSTDEGLLRLPIDRIPAMPEQLALIVGADAADADAVAAAFIKQINKVLPAGTSFCGFCSYGTWTPESPHRPHFFGMLWFTCMIAYGYPTSDGSFEDRFVRALGKVHNYQCLAQLWTDAAHWTRARRADGESVRELQLPPVSEHRRIIGHSHFLAFPSRSDRRSLSKVLEDAGLVGFEPPLDPVVKALASARRVFSKEFTEDLEDFQRRYSKGEDPRNNAFWKAVRREALNPLTGTLLDSGERPDKTALLFLEDEQGLRPIVACQFNARLPDGFEAHPSEGLAGWVAYVSGPGGDLEKTWQEAFGTGRLLPVGTRRLISQGVLVLRESSGGQYEVVHGADIHGCRRALVSSAVLQSFVAAFPGRSGNLTVERSVVDDWFEIDGCEVRQVDESPPGLHAVTQLLRTMSPPAVAFVGGLPTANGFLFVPQYLPLIRALGAASRIQASARAPFPLVPVLRTSRLHRTPADPTSGRQRA